MTYIRGGHVTGKTARHTFDDINAWYTNLSIKDMRETLLDGCTEEEFNERKIVYECKAGDALIFPQTTPHRSLTNFTDKTRWSLDYRYHASDTPGLENPLDWFYGVKDSLPLYRRDDPDFKPDWGKWAKVNRNVIDLEGKVESAEDQK